MFLKLATFYKKIKLPKGRVDRGKYRIVKKVTPLAMAKVKGDLEIERRNMLYLRNPYVLNKELTCVPKPERALAELFLIRSRREQIRKFLKCQESRKLDVFLKTALGSSEKWDLPVFG